MAKNELERVAWTTLINNFNANACHLWNNGRLEDFCNGYAVDALYITAKGIAEGRDAILKAYLEEFPTQAERGHITTRLVKLLLPSDVESEKLPDEPRLDMAVAVVEFYVTVDNDQTQKGLSTLTFVDDPTSELAISIATDTSP